MESCDCDFEADTNNSVIGTHESSTASIADAALMNKMALKGFMRVDICNQSINQSTFDNKTRGSREISPRPRSRKRHTSWL